MLSQKALLLPGEQPALALKCCQACRSVWMTCPWQRRGQRYSRPSVQSHPSKQSPAMSPGEGGSGRKQAKQAAVNLQGSSTVPQWPGHPTVFLTGLGGFLALVTDLFSPTGAKFTFQNIDQPTHAWVLANIPGILRDVVFEIGISNISILLATAGWALLTGILLSDTLDDQRGIGTNAGSSAEPLGVAVLKVRALRRLAVGWILYILAGGFIIPGDNFLVRWLKHSCERVRPSTRHMSFSFPSGHTAGVTFLVGALLLVLLPALLDLVEARSRAPGGMARQGVLRNEAVLRLVRASVENGGKIWVGAFVSTAAGRVLGDVHWVTDTAGGALLGIALVSGFAIISKRLDRAVAGE